MYWHRTKIDIVIVDYIDIIKPLCTSSFEFEKQYAKLKEISKSHNIKFIINQHLYETIDGYTYRDGKRILC